MIVVSDTSPLNYLILIDAIEVLPKIYQQVFAPPKVIAELSHSGSPDRVRTWARSTPAWLIMQSPKHVDITMRLHPGEAEAISLAQELAADWLLIDERRGRDAAKARGIKSVGILGVLFDASGRDLLNLRDSIDRLTKNTNFHIDKVIIEEVLRRDAARREPRSKP